MSPLRELWGECLRHGTVKYPGMSLPQQVRRLTHALTAFLNHLDEVLGGNELLQRELRSRVKYLRTLRDVPPPTRMELHQ